jgi:phospholipase C
MGISWTVYSDAVVAPSLTRTMFPKLWDPLLDGHFKRFADFEQGCQTGTLASYSFIGPSFLTDPNAEHPPHDVGAREQFLLRIWNAVRQSPKWNETLLIVTYDEHGGTYDHVLPPTGAVPPDLAGQPGQYGFGFDRFGVRVPAILVSPWIEKGTIFRSNTGTPLDHTSILATLRDWQNIPPETMLPSKRVAQSPALEYVLTRSSPRTDTPTFPLVGTPNATALNLPPNDLQRSLVSGTATRYGMDPRTVLATVKTRQHAIDFFAARSPHLAPRQG